ncbi:MAG: HIT family protein [Phycisphaerales bacterium]
MSDNRAQGQSGGEGVGSGPAAIWAPWRLAYIESLSEDQDSKDSAPSSRSAAPPGSTSGSFLLDYWNTPELDQEHYVIERTDAGLILLNRYPYSNGHLLIALGDARPALMDYEPDQRAALWELVDRATALAELALEPQGLNIGINQGRAGGAGVPSHLHVHVIPRWSGDTNFITSVGGIRVIPGALEAMYERYMRAVAASN